MLEKQLTAVWLLGISFLPIDKEKEEERSKNLKFNGRASIKFRRELRPMIYVVADIPIIFSGTSTWKQTKPQTSLDFDSFIATAAR